MAAQIREAQAVCGTAVLGSKAALAAWLNVHRSQVTRLERGQEIGHEPGWRLAGLGAVVGALSQVYDPEVIPDWLKGINAHLNHQRPIDLLHQGRVAEVMAAVEAARTGSYA
ncbi:MAG: hypothetical protein ACREMO_11390 [Gemmatimonadales bacterium]